MRRLAGTVLALLTDQPFKLRLSSHSGADWMPRLPLVTQADVEVYEADTPDDNARECRRAAPHFHQPACIQQTATQHPPQQLPSPPCSLD